VPRRMLPMKKALRLMLALTVVCSLFAVGFAGTAAADYKDKKAGDSQSSWQVASSHVDQDQDVKQSNVNVQDDNTAISASAAWKGGTASSGDATAIQANAQSNKNAQVAYSNAQNFNWQNQD
jgi:hypothetical protein